MEKYRRGMMKQSMDVVGIDGINRDIVSIGESARKHIMICPVNRMFEYQPIYFVAVLSCICMNNFESMTMLIAMNIFDRGLLSSESIRNRSPYLYTIERAIESYTAIIVAPIYRIRSGNGISWLFYLFYCAIIIFFSIIVIIVIGMKVYPCRSRHFNTGIHCSLFRVDYFLSSFLFLFPIFIVPLLFLFHCFLSCPIFIFGPDHRYHQHASASIFHWHFRSRWKAVIE